MALNGINMPLAFNGQEYVWQMVYKQLGLNDQDLGTFFSGWISLASLTPKDLLIYLGKEWEI